MAGAVNDGSGTGSSLDKALAVVRGAVATAKGRAALAVLENELQAGGQDNKDKTSKGGPPVFPKRGNAAAIKAAMVSSAKGGGTA